MPLLCFDTNAHGWLEAIDIQTQRPVEFLQLSQGVLPYKAIIAHDLTDDRSIFLFHKTVIIFHAWTPSGEGQVLLLTIGYHQIIEKLRTIVGINSMPARARPRSRVHNAVGADAERLVGQRSGLIEHRETELAEMAVKMQEKKDFS